eukprot:2183403-Prymnesium_polylepis.1
MSGPVPSRMSSAMPLSSASSLPAEARIETVACYCIMMAVLPVPYRTCSHTHRRAYAAGSAQT